MNVLYDLLRGGEIYTKIKKILLYIGDNITMTQAEVECPYCGEVFRGETEADARTQEGVHRAENHVNDGQSTTKASKGRNIIDEWKTEGKRA